MAIKIKNVKTGEVIELKNTGFVDGKPFVFGKGAPTRWVAKNPMFVLTGNILGQGAYCKYELHFIENQGYEMLPEQGRKPREKNAPKPKPEPKPEPEQMPKVEPAPTEEYTEEYKLEDVETYARECVELGVKPSFVWEEMGKYGDDRERLFGLLCEKLVLDPNHTLAELDAKMAQRTKPTKTKVDAQPAPQPTVQVTGDAVTAALMPLFGGVATQVASQVEDRIMSKVQPLLDRVPQEVVHVVKRIDGSEWKADGEVFHPNFESVLNRINNGMWVYLYGPTGSGKNVMAEQIARALGLNFYYQAHTLDRFELTGFIDAAGTYQPSEFYKAYTGGGLFMLDELDASDENALITLNSACNGYFAFPNGTVKAHPDFRCIAAGNTCGRGATDDYTARRVMDASSLGRFVPRYHGYTRVVDMASAMGDEVLVNFFEKLREIKKATGVQMLLSPRQIKAIKMLEKLEPLSQILNDTLATYLTVDDLHIVQDKVKSDDIYSKAFVKIKKEEY